MAAESILSSDEMQLVTFTLGQETYGLDIINVQEIIRMPSITAIPKTPVYVEGVANLRGSIMPVIDTGVKFGIGQVEKSVSNRVIVVDVRGKKVGLSVEAVSEVLRIESQRIEAVPAMLSGADNNSITGVVRINNADKLVMILEASSLMSIDQPVNQATNIITNQQNNKNREDIILTEEQLVTFLIGNEEFALEIDNIREIIRYPDIVKVPNMPEYIKGVISLRDKLVPILDMRLKLVTGTDEITNSTRVIIIDVNYAWIGLVVDRVVEVARIPRDTIFAPPLALSGDARDRLKGIARVDGGRRIIMLIDPSNIITQDKLQEMEADNVLSSQGEENMPVNKQAEEQMVVFKLAGEQYGIRITQVQEINRLSKITNIPRTPRFIEGVINLRGDVIPLIDLRKRFEIESKNYNEFSRVIVSDINNRKIGITVDEVMEVLRISENLLEETPEMLQGGKKLNFTDGIANLGHRMIVMLNLENILLEKEWQKLDDMEYHQYSINKTPAPRLKKQGK